LGTRECQNLGDRSRHGGFPLPLVVLSTLPNLPLLLKSKMAAIAFARPQNTPALQAVENTTYHLYRSRVGPITPFKAVKSDQGSPKGPKGIVVDVKFPVPHPLPSHKLKKSIKPPPHPSLPTPNISFSPSSLYFRSDFSLLPTFFRHFSLLPIPFLPPLVERDFI